MNILVTGGAGFLGSHLCEYLLRNGHKVICLDNFFTGSRANIEHLTSNKDFRVMEADIINPFYIEEKIDQVYNLACPASPVHYQFNPIRTVKANTIGVINVLGFAKKHGARVFQASTSEIYGDPLEHPQKETYRGNVNTIGPRACYDEGKRVAETLFFDYHRSHGIEIRVARIFNTYGPRMAKNDGRVVSNFIVQALNGEDITIYGTGEQTRSFCYVSDLVEGFYKLMNPTHNEECGCDPKDSSVMCGMNSDTTGPVNLGNPGEFTMKELAEKVITLTGSKSKIIYGPLPEDDPRQRKPDISLAKTKLDWQPAVPLEEGLKKTIDYFRGKL